MKRFFQHVSRVAGSPVGIVIALLIIAVLAYGLLIPQMGFYWDEIPMSWIRYELGPAAMTRYFSTNRPVWGLLYQVTTHFLPQIPIYWEAFALFWRWVSAVLVYAISRSLWPGRRGLGLLVALFFLLYPGFNQQWTSYLYSHFFIVLCFLLTSFLCTLWSIRNRRWYWPLTVAAMVFSALNLWMMEYFFTLELLRPVVIAAALFGQDDSDQRTVQRREFLVLWLPYLLVFGADVLWRLLVFNNQIYQPTLLPQLKTQPVAALVALGVAVIGQLYTVILPAWAQVFAFPDLVVDGPRSVTFYWIVLIIACALIALLVRREFNRQKGAAPRSLWPIGVGVAALLTAGGPFWLTGLEVTIAYPANRFTLPFMLGVSLLLAGLIELAPASARLVLATALLGLATGRQALWAESYMHDWNAQRNLFWEMIWRAPGIAPNTIVLLNEGALPYYADNSLTGTLNWIYDPNNRSERMDYVLFYPTSRREGTLRTLEPGQSITYDFISEVFSGNTSQTLAFYYQPPGCLRLLDPAIDPENHLVPEASMMREAASLSSSRWIEPESEARMPQIYGPEPAHGWCYHFEKAELAAQSQDWAEVVALGDEASNLGDHPNDPVERFVFVEGLAHVGSWDRALVLSDESYAVSKTYMAPLLCRLWQRIDVATPASPEKTATLAEVKRMYSCSGE